MNRGNREQLVSVVAVRAQRYIDKKIPSRLIPFRGNFPIIEEHRMPLFIKAIMNNKWLSELTPEYQEAVRKGNMIAIYEKGFRDYLFDKGVSEENFLKSSSPEKADILMKWMENDNVDYNRLNIH